MNKFIKSIVLTTAASGMLLASSAMAADQKIAVVNFQEVMSKIPQSAVIMQALEAEFKDEKAILVQLEKDIKYYQEKKVRDGSLMSAKEKEDLDKKIGTLYQEFQVKGKAFQQRASKRQNEENNKVLALISQAVSNIAAKKDYDMVIERKAIIFSKPEVSITEEVIKQVSKLK